MDRDNETDVKLSRFQHFPHPPPLGAGVLQVERGTLWDPRLFHLIENAAHRVFGTGHQIRVVDFQVPFLLGTQERIDVVVDGGGYCQVKRNRDDRPQTYLVRDGTRAHHLGGRSA